MDFALSDEQTAIFDMAHGFAQDNIAPHARDWEDAGTIPRPLWAQVGELGFGAICVREDSGGSGLSRLDATLIYEAMAMACPSVAAFLSIHNMCAAMLDRVGSEALKARVLPDVNAMNTIMSYCLTEPGSGSDAAGLRTRAERTADGYVLNGTKAFISGGGYSDGYIVMARTGGDGPSGISALLVEDGTPGLSFGAPEDKMGWKAQPTAQVQFEDCHIPAANLIGEEGRGFSYAMQALDGGRLNISACSLGAAQSALNRTITYMSERVAFGKTLDQFQALQFRLADIETELQAARALLRMAAWKLDTGAADAAKFCAMAKTFVTEAGSKSVNQCLQLHGGYGYLAEYGIEKLVRDLRVHEILEGTNEIMRLIIARSLLADT